MRTTLRVRSSGRLKVWNSVLFSSKVFCNSRKCVMSVVCTRIWPVEDDFAVKQSGFRFGSLNMVGAIFRQDVVLRIRGGGRI